jgi:hypothetical protein
VCKNHSIAFNGADFWDANFGIQADDNHQFSSLLFFAFFLLRIPSPVVHLLEGTWPAQFPSLLFCCVHFATGKNNSRVFVFLAAFN